MTAGEAAQKIRELSSELRSDYDKYFLASVTGLTAIIQDRVQGSSTDYKGRKFSNYSTKKVQAMRFYDDATRVKKGLSQLKALQKQRQEISYFDFRKLIGKTNTALNFDLSGDMWLNFGAKPEGKKVVIGFRSRSASQKAEDNSRLENVNIIQPSEGEVRGLADHLADFIFNKIKEKGLTT